MKEMEVEKEEAWERSHDSVESCGMLPNHAGKLRNIMEPSGCFTEYQCGKVASK